MAVAPFREPTHRLFYLMVAFAVILLTCLAAWLGIARETPKFSKRVATPLSVLTDENVVAGTVVGPHGAIANATVRWQTHDAAVLTDCDGRFRLPCVTVANLIAASAPGHYVSTGLASGTNPTLFLEPLPTHDDIAYSWIDPSPQSVSRHRCSLCHERIYSEWLLSAHARSGSNRRVLSLIEGTADDGVSQAGPSLRRDHPHGVAVCNSCHAPTLETNDPHWNELAARAPSPLNGVHCDFCHKTQSVDISNIGLTHGRYAMRLLRPNGERQLVFGPHDDANRGDSAATPLYRSSDYCASCHEGTVFGVQAYTTFSEWQASPAASRGQQCQTCHMPAADDVTNMAPGHGGVTRASGSLSDHSLRGPASRRYADSLAVSLATSRRDGFLHVSVLFDASLVGHCVPTGFIDKHLLLIVDAFDMNGRHVSQAAGPRIPDFVSKSAAGRAGEFFGRVLTDSQGDRPAAFWAAVVEHTDTRIRPDTPRTVTLSFDASAKRLRIQVLHRRFWEKTQTVKQWADDTQTLIDCLCGADEPPTHLLNPLNRAATLHSSTESEKVDEPHH